MKLSAVHLFIKHHKQHMIIIVYFTSKLLISQVYFVLFEGE